MGMLEISYGEREKERERERRKNYSICAEKWQIAWKSCDLPPLTTHGKNYKFQSPLLINLSNPNEQLT